MWSSLVVLIFIFIVALFSVYNADFVLVSYIFGTARVRLALVIVISALVGALVVVISSFTSQVQMRRVIAEMKAKIEKIEGGEPGEEKE